MNDHVSSDQRVGGSNPSGRTHETPANAGFDAKGASVASPPASPPVRTTQELWDMVHELRAQGFSNSEIAEKCGISTTLTGQYFLKARPNRSRRLNRTLINTVSYCGCGRVLGNPTSKKCNSCERAARLAAVDQHRQILSDHITETGRIPTCSEAGRLTGLSRGRAAEILAEVVGSGTGNVRRMRRAGSDPASMADKMALKLWSYGQVKHPVLYAIQAGENGPIKIGSSANPHVRRREFQTGHYEVLYLIAVDVTRGRDHEKELQHELREYSLRGEWFTPSPEVLEVVKSMQAVAA